MDQCTRLCCACGLQGNASYSQKLHAHGQLSFDISGMMQAV